MNNPIDIETVIFCTREILAELLVSDIENISPESKIIDDLSADSLDIVDLSYQLGKRFGCTLPKTNVLDHAIEVCGDSEDFVKNGGITTKGIGLLENSLSGYSSGQLQEGMRPAEVFSITTVRNWANQCFKLFNYLPNECPECGGTQAEVNERNQVVCCGCLSNLTPSEGDTVSRKLVESYVEKHLEVGV